LEQTALDAALTPRQRQETCSALRAVGRAIGRRLEEIPAHPRLLGERLAALTPAMAGVSRGRWNNVLSLTRGALKRVGLATIAGRSTEPMTAEWRDLFGHLNHRRMREGLSRFARYCGDRGISPIEVNDDIAVAFLNALENEGLIRKPHQVHRTMCVQWNRAAQLVPALSLMPLTVPQYKVAYSLPWDAFPPSLRAEVAVYLARLSGEDLLAGGDFRPLRPASIQSYDRLFRAYLSALVHRGRDIASLRSLADIVAVETIKDGLRFFIERADGKATKQAYYIARLLLAVARHHVKVETAHLEELRGICRRLDPGKTGLTVKNRDRLRQFDNPAHVHALVSLPQKIWARHKGRANPTRADALAVQNALAVEIFLMVPMRIANLASLDSERNILRTRAKGATVTHLAIAAENVKNGMAIEAELPADTVKLLDLYLERFRPVLLSQPSSWLFPNGTGGPKKAAALGLQISKFLRRECGLQINPHLFRHIAAKLYLEAHPGAYGVVRLIHGHSSVDTTTRAYCGTETAAAMRHFDAHVLRLRRQTPLPPLRRGRRPAQEAPE
jgi:integrase